MATVYKNPLIFPSLLHFARVSLVANCVSAYMLLKESVLESMAKLIHKLEVETEVKCSADKFYVTFKNNMNHLPNLIPEHCKGFQLVEGDGKSVGTVRLWKNIVEGNIVEVKEKLEAMDDKNRSITFNVCMIEGGDAMINLYKSLTYTVNVNPRKGDEYCSVKWTMEVEKANEKVPTPNMFLDLTTITTEAMARLLVV